MSATVPAMKTIFMCSGQGSQYYQMGRELFLQHADFRRCMQEMDRVAVELCGNSVLRDLYDPARSKADWFDELALTSPAIFMVEFALGSLLMQAGTVPDCILGSSLGVFAAAALGGCLQRDEALRAVLKQSEIIQRECQKGGMVSILGDAALIERPPLSGLCELAALNFPNHFTVAGPIAHLERIERHLSAVGVTFQRLAVNYAFHSKWIEAAGQPLEAGLRSVQPRAARIPLACCVGARTIHELPQGYFWSVARQPIRLCDTIRTLEKDGPHRYIDVGPAGSLATMVKYALAPGSRSSVHAAMSPYASDLRTLQTLQRNIAAQERVHAALT